MQARKGGAWMSAQSRRRNSEAISAQSPVAAGKAAPDQLLKSAVLNLRIADA